MYCPNLVIDWVIAIIEYARGTGGMERACHACGSQALCTVEARGTHSSLNNGRGTIYRAPTVYALTPALSHGERGAECPLRRAVHQQPTLFASNPDLLPQRAKASVFRVFSAYWLLSHSSTAACIWSIARSTVSSAVSAPSSTNARSGPVPADAIALEAGCGK